MCCCSSQPGMGTQPPCASKSGRGSNKWLVQETFIWKGGMGTIKRAFLYCMESLDTAGQLHSMPMMSKTVQLSDIEASE
jgi:hypothetical protein